LLAFTVLEHYFERKIMSDTPTPIAEIDHGPSKFDEFLENNQKKLVILAIAIFLAVVAYVFLKGYNKMQAENAGALLLEASNEEEYNKVISEYPGETAAGTAAYTIAAMRTSDEDAIEAFNHFISTYPEHPMVALAEFNLAQHQINAGKTAEATATLEALIDKDNADFIIPKATIALGDIALANGEKEQAEKLYNDAINFNESKHSFVGEAQTKINYISASKPAMVDAPPKPIEPKPLDPIKPVAPTEEPIKKLELPGSSPAPVIPAGTAQPAPVPAESTEQP